MYGEIRMIPIRSKAMFWGLLIWVVAVLVVRPNLSKVLAHERGVSVPFCPAGSPNPQDLRVFFDQLVPQQLDEFHIPGAAIAVVKDGELVFSQGYGSADLDQGRPVVADRTLFRTGSVAKLFTWTAVMQLVEQDKLDLSTDVNTYLSGFQIPDTYPEPITLEHLLTHTAGFEDGSMGTMRRLPEDLEPLDAFLARRIPARIFPPGQVTAYSNYGTALAGYIVAQVSSLPFEQVVQQNILTPLGMDRTTFQQPAPAPLAGDLATGYAFVEGAFRSQPFEVYQIGPAGGASTTVTDMARFIIAHLQGGLYSEGKDSSQRILGQDTVELMHQVHFRNDPRLAGMAYGFYEHRVNGRLLLTHAGDTSVFRSQLVLLPEEDMGLYVVYNAPGGRSARDELVQAFFDRFYPAASTTVLQPLAGAVERTRQVEGRYVSTRSPQTTIDKLRLLTEPLYQPITVRATQGGFLETDHPAVRSQNPVAYQPSRWVEVEPGLYGRPDGSDRLVFRHDEDGNTMLFLDNTPPRGYRRLTGYEELLYQPLLPLGLMALLLGVLGFAVFDRNALPAARWLAVGAGGVVLAFAVGLVAFALLGFMNYVYGIVLPVWWVVFALPLTLILLTIALAVCIALPWPEPGVIRRAPYALAVAAAVGLLVWANYWNLIGWRF